MAFRHREIARGVGSDTRKATVKRSTNVRTSLTRKARFITSCASILIDPEGRIRNIYSSETLDPRLVLADVKTLILEAARLSKH